MLVILIVLRPLVLNALLQTVFVKHAPEKTTELERLSTTTATATIFAMPMKSLAVRRALLAITILKRQTLDHAFLQRVFVKHALEKTTELERLSTTTATATMFAMPMKSLAVRIALRVTMTSQLRMKEVVIILALVAWMNPLAITKRDSLCLLRKLVATSILNLQFSPTIILRTLHGP